MSSIRHCEENEERLMEKNKKNQGESEAWVAHDVVPIMLETRHINPRCEHCLHM